MIVHNIPAVFDEHSTILILGSFPSVKSREEGFFYGHSRNRFWRVLSEVYGRPVPESVEEKRSFLLSSGIALWDVIGSCDISNSDDSSIRNAVPNDINLILKKADIRAIYVNGKTADKYYRKYILPQTGRHAVCLPSTSPANASCSFDRLVSEWRIIKEKG